MLPVKDMQHRFLSILVSFVILLSGCTTSVEEIASSEPPLQLSFSAKTLDRAEDGGSEFNLKQTLEDKPVLVLWIAAGCSGCHDWTKMIRESISNGSINSSFVNVSVPPAFLTIAVSTAKRYSGSFIYLLIIVPYWVCHL